MDLRKASRWFDDIQILDAYSGAALYFGQVSSFLDNNADGTISTRRVLSLAPDLAPPPRRAIAYLGEKWLVGDSVTDGLQGNALRSSYRMVKVTHRYTLCTPAQAALGQSGTNVYAQKMYLKSTTNNMADAEYGAFWEITVSQTEALLKGAFLISEDGEYCRARGKHDLIDGFRIVEADQLDDGCFVEVILQPKVMDPITQTLTGVASATTGIVIDAYQAFEYKTQADPKYAAGDKLVILAKLSGTPIVGQRITVAGKPYKVFSVTEDLDAWKCLVRLA
jgi:hypothetical protein